VIRSLLVFFELKKLQNSPISGRAYEQGKTLETFKQSKKRPATEKIRSKKSNQ
jgi:hypothetical protein